MLAKGSLFSRLIHKYWVTSNYVPLQAATELQLDLNRPIIYVVEQNSASDLLGLQASCLKAGLPDPYQKLTINGESVSALIFIDDWYLFSQKSQQPKTVNPNTPYLKQYQQLLQLHKDDAELDIQLVPVTFYWGRNPGKQGKNSWFDLLEQRRVGALHKSLVVLKKGKDHLIRFNHPISIAALCEREKSAQQLAHKLAKVAIRYFGRQKRSSVGPKLPKRSEMINAVLQQPKLQQAIKESAAREQISESEITAQCRTYLEEISANFSYSSLRIFRVILSWLWNHIYQGIEVNRAQTVRQACQSGAEIIYMPCHRSHMDYLLLSYLLFEQGLVPPHVAAGVNLNFFPAGPIFRRSGAFFLRRTFKDSPLYAQVFNAYFAMLFKQGYPIEFFTEGGRSRSGRLLTPKTGLLAMSLQTYINQPERNVIIVPVYIGYDHIMEVNTYTKELAGEQKKSESVWQVFASIKKLRNFGRVSVNFGEPINMKQHFDNALPNWQKSGVSEQQLKQQVASVAHDTMVAINAATAVNALPLCAALLLAQKDLQLNKALFFEHINKHQQLLALLNRNNLLTYAQGNASDVYQQAKTLNKFSESSDSVFCSQEQAVQLSYYRNNIIHLFALSSLLCHSVRYLMFKNQPLTAQNIIFYSAKIYPFLQAEYFLDNKQDTQSLLMDGLKQLQEIGVFSVADGCYIINDDLLLSVMVGHLKETFLRYQQLLSQLLNSTENWQGVDQKALTSACKKALHTRSIEPYDEKLLLQFLARLKKSYPDFINQQQGKVLLDIFYHAF